MAQSGPGKHYRRGVSMMEIADMFSTEASATRWFESWLWPDGEIACMKCGSLNAYRVKTGKPMPYRCRDCRQYFSLKTGTAMEDSKLPIRLWGWAIYLEMTNLKGVSSMKLSRDLKVRQPTAWYMAPPDPGSVRRCFRHVRRPGRGRRDLHGRAGEKQACLEEAQGWTRPCWQDGCRRNEGPPDRPGCCPGSPRFTARDRSEIRRGTLEAWGQDLHGRGRRLLWPTEPRERLAWRRGMGPGHGPHERGGVLLDHAQAGPQGDLSPTLGRAPAALRGRVRRASQHPGT